ncbi:MAG TPA: prepilin-type N-terminal cleavage/methylation domain-containing protein [Chthoniobacteraceae bacterium]|nr:prepilin-type N-terminal cleavage/methylation domain-containing protein [Chthoniobacteraceae bacterium]
MFQKTENRFPCQSAFSLVELLVAIAVAAALAALVFMGLRGVFAAGDRARCISNLRQIGSAVAAYAQDHHGQLPGSTATVQHWTYYTFTTRRGAGLTVWLAPYLALPPPVSGGSVAECFVCPAARRQVRERHLTTVNASYGAGVTLIEETGKKVFPFGYYSSSTVNEILPLKLQTIPTEVSKTLALLDADRVKYAGNVVVPEVPSHGTFRNALYLDGHVAPLPLE